VPSLPPNHRPASFSGRQHEVKQTDRQSRRAYHTGSKGWRLIRRDILVRDAFTCVKCGHMDGSNEVDHIDGDSGNNDPSNLRTMCKPCHAKHGKKGVQTSERKYVIA
jgi:5-methylcytosine-specific restriction endonuclease McrA